MTPYQRIAKTKPGKNLPAYDTVWRFVDRWVPIDKSPRRRACWNGRSISLHILETESTHPDEVRVASNLLHELAHWLLAPPDHRKLVGFGLGIEPQSRCGKLARGISYTAANEAEALASVLGILMEKHLHLDPAFTADLHLWADEPELFNSRVKELAFQGLCTEQGVLKLGNFR